MNVIDSRHEKVVKCAEKFIIVGHRMVHLHSSC